MRSVESISAGILEKPPSALICLPIADFLRSLERCLENKNTMNSPRYRNATITPAVQMLLIANIGVYLLEMLDPGLLTGLALWPLGAARVFPPELAGAHFQPWQLVTYAFLHGSLLHIALNMYGLWLFGVRMEQVWGSRAFLIFYFVCVVGAGLTQLLVTSLSGQIYPTIGASGGVFGLLLAFGMTFPEERLMLVFPPVILKAKWFVVLYGAIELWAGVTGTQAGVAHFAHLGGMAFGYGLIRYWREHPPSAS